jgi:hypothetical protein
MSDIFDNLGGTKFAGFIFITLLGFILILTSDINTAKDFMTFAFGMFGLYVAGNTVSKFSKNQNSA